MSKKSKLNIIDENDQIIGEDTRENIHKGGLLHREVHVWLYNKKGEVILQKRALDKETRPGLLDASAGGHVEYNDSYEKAALKELKEETGIDTDKNKLIFLKKIRRVGIYDEKTRKINNNFKAVYAYEYNGRVTDLVLERGKATSLEFWPIDKILNIPENEKKYFVPAFFTDDYFKIFHMIKDLAQNKKNKYINNLGVFISEPKSSSSNLAILLPGYLDSQNYAHLASLRKLLSQKGCIAVSFDPMGVWDSNSEDISSYSISRYLLNIEEIISYFESQQKLSKIILIGHSLGGQVAIIAASKNPRISAVVAIMPPQGNSRKLKWQKGMARESSRDLPNDVNKRIKFLVPYAFVEDAEQYNSLDAVNKISSPILFIAGELDKTIISDRVKEIYDKANQPKSFVIINDIGHDYRHYENQTTEVNNVIIDFLTEYKLI